jgi:hypothetical protein
MKLSALALGFLSFTSAVSGAVTLNQCKAELHRFDAISCTGGTSLVPGYCVGADRTIGPLTFNLNFDANSGSGSATLQSVELKSTESFLLNCAPTKNYSGYLDCVSDRKVLAVGDRTLIVRVRTQDLGNGAHYVWVGAPGEGRWFASFQSSQVCH